MWVAISSPQNQLSPSLLTASINVKTIVFVMPHPSIALAVI